MSKTEVSITVPAEFYEDMARLADLLNAAVADDGQYQRGVSCLENIHHQITTLADTAVEMLKVVMAERDLAIQDKLDAELLQEAAELKLEDLETALDEYYWSDHPAVRQLVQRVQEDVEEVMADEYYDSHIETTADDMAAYVAQVTGLGHTDCMTFARAIIDGDVTTPEARYWDRETFAKVLMALAEKYKGIK